MKGSWSGQKGVFRRVIELHWCVSLWLKHGRPIVFGSFTLSSSTLMHTQYKYLQIIFIIKEKAMNCFLRWTTTAIFCVFNYHWSNFKNLVGFSVKEIPFMNSCIEYVFLNFDNDNENSEVSTLSFEYIFYRLVFEVDRLFEQSHSCICLHGPLSKTTSRILASFFFRI